MARFGTNVMNWFIEPKNDLNFFIFLGIGKLLIAKVLPSNGEFPDIIIVKPSYFFLKN